MHFYNLQQWIVIFFCYCFLGWCIESTYVSINSRKLVNRGFLNMPFLPIYGFGAVTVLFITLPVKDNIFYVYIGGLISATILEYFTGLLMEKTLKIKYWDYSNWKYQYKGRISLTASLFWGFLSIVLVFVVQDPIDILIVNMTNRITITLSSVLLFLFVIDFSISIKASIDLEKLLQKVYFAENEIEKLKDQIQDIYTVTSNKLSNVKELSENELKEITTSFKNNTDSLKESIELLSIEVKEEIKKVNFISLRIMDGYPKAHLPNVNIRLGDLKGAFMNKLSNGKKEFEEKRNTFLKKIDKYKNTKVK